ncbi:MAG: radical SAM protein, partial [Gemmatimonadota bacterium]|nr:radical SAM protein [Gemmatimonadota bacterium]
NHQISQPATPLTETAGIEPLDTHSLARTFLEIQDKGCENLNLVTATSHLPVILEALGLAADSGLRLPLVYNSSGYESVACLRLLDSVVDIYLPDMKFGDPSTPGGPENLLAGATVADYVEVNREAVAEMFRQVGFLSVDYDSGRATGGLIVRHLILPARLAVTRGVLEFLSREISSEVHISLLAQYYPAHLAAAAGTAKKYPLLARKITGEEYSEACALLEEYNFGNGWVQELESQGLYRPDFTREDPFTA